MCALQLYASKICCYAQGMCLIQAASLRFKWNLNLGEIARIWKGGCIIRAKFLDRIKVCLSVRSFIHSIVCANSFGFSAFLSLLTSILLFSFRSLSLSLSLSVCRKRMIVIPNLLICYSMLSLPKTSTHDKHL